MMASLSLLSIAHRTPPLEAREARLMHEPRAGQLHGLVVGLRIRTCRFEREYGKRVRRASDGASRAQTRVC